MLKESEIDLKKWGSFILALMIFFFVRQYVIIRAYKTCATLCESRSQEIDLDRSGTVLWRFNCYCDYKQNLKQKVKIP